MSQAFVEDGIGSTYEELELDGNCLRQRLGPTALEGEFGFVVERKPAHALGVCCRGWGRSRGSSCCCDDADDGVGETDRPLLGGNGGASCESLKLSLFFTFAPPELDFKNGFTAEYDKNE